MLFCLGLFFAWSNLPYIDPFKLSVYIIFATIPSVFFIVYIAFWIKNRKTVILEKYKMDVKKKSWIDSMKDSESDFNFNAIQEIPGLTVVKKQKHDIVYDVPSSNKYHEVISRLRIEYLDYLKALKLIIRLKSDSLVSLEIQRRDSVFAKQEDELIIPRLSNAYVLNSSTPEVWTSLSNDTIFIEDLLLLRPHLEHFSLKGQFIEVILYSEKAITKVLDWILELNPSMEKLAESIKATKAEKILCYNCQEPFDLLEETCSNCGSPRPKCIICFQDLKPEVDTDVIILPCCKIYAHKDHIMMWLLRKSNCPNCHHDLSRWANEIRI